MFKLVPSQQALGSGEKIVPQPNKKARIEFVYRKYGTYWRWRWQKKDEYGRPLKTKHGGYRRGSRYGGKVKNEQHKTTLGNT